MNEDSPTVTAVVVTYNRKELLQECLRALVTQTKTPDEIVVIDNASTDGTRTLLETEFPSITAVYLSENAGYTSGVARGIQMALERGSDWVWVMDDDACPRPDALDNLLIVYEQLGRPFDVAALQCQVYNFNEQVSWGTWKLRKGVIGIFAKGVAEPLLLSDQVIEIDLAPFVGFLVKTSVAREIGLPRQELFLSVDDWDYCVRIKQRGYRVLAVPTSIMWHKKYVPEHRGHTLSRARRAQYYYHTARNNIFFCREHSPYLGLAPAMVGISRQVLKGVPLAVALLLKGDKQSRQVSSAIVKGILDGLRKRLGPTPAEFLST